MKITALTLEQAKVIFEKILKYEKYLEISVDKTGRGVKITLKIEEGHKGCRFLQINEDGEMEYQGPAAGPYYSSHGTSYETYTRNTVPIIDYLREQGYVFNYERNF